jgi:hypothetical protein
VAKRGLPNSVNGPKRYSGDRFKVEFKPFTRGDPILICEHRDKNLPNYAVVFQRGGYDVETLYWAGSIEEVRELAEGIAFRGGADTYRIVEFTGGNLRSSVSDTW